VSVFDLLNPIKDVADIANSIISKFVADPNEKLALQQQVLTATTALQSKALDLSSQVVDAQSKIITAEATGTSWLERDWRPLLMLFFAIVVGFAVFNSAHDLSGRPIDPALVADAMTIVKIGVGGYVAQPVIAALKSNGGNNGTGK
jgi:Holin of 3TMs, for gene-transfer release